MLCRVGTINSGFVRHFLLHAVARQVTQNKLLFVTGDRKTTRDALTLDQFQDIIANLGKLEENDRLYILLIM